VTINHRVTINDHQHWRLTHVPIVMHHCSQVACEEANVMRCVQRLAQAPSCHDHMQGSQHVCRMCGVVVGWVVVHRVRVLVLNGDQEPGEMKAV
jgi:hypothetical protein